MSKTSNHAKLICLKPWLGQLQTANKKQSVSKSDLVTFKRNRYEK
jgi:hypothetical protein